MIAGIDSQAGGAEEKIFYITESSFQLAPDSVALKQMEAVGANIFYSKKQKSGLVSNKAVIFSKKPLDMVAVRKVFKDDSAVARTTGREFLQFLGKVFPTKKFYQKDLLNRLQPF